LIAELIAIMTSLSAHLRTVSRLTLALAPLGNLCVVGSAAEAQITPDQVREIRASIANRIEALTILGGDFGFSGAKLSLAGEVLPGERADERLSGTKFGGAGDIGEPRPLGDGPIRWQGRIQGNMGHLDWTDDLRSPLLGGDRSEFTANAIEFGGGARFWFGDALSIAPTFMGVYGHVSNRYYPSSSFSQTNFNELRTLGLVDWHVDVWSLRPAVNVQYLVNFDRSVLTLSSDVTYFHTEGFHRSNSRVVVGGDSGFVTNKVDLDVPLGLRLAGHELKTGGYVSRTDLLGDLEGGLGVQHLNEIHGRFVLDYLNQLWKFEWIGMGASYIWGTDTHGWAAGVDVKFKF
jgi:hypothetical protein